VLGAVHVRRSKELAVVVDEFLAAAGVQRERRKVLTQWRA